MLSKIKNGVKAVLIWLTKRENEEKLDTWQATLADLFGVRKKEKRKANTALWHRLINRKKMTVLKVEFKRAVAVD